MACRGCSSIPYKQKAGSPFADPEKENVQRMVGQEIVDVVEAETEALEKKERLGELKTADKGWKKISTEFTHVSRAAPNMHPGLYRAAKRGDTDSIKKLKAEDIEHPVFSQKTPKLNTVLHIAASLDNSELVEVMLDNHHELWMMKNSADELALHVAASCGRSSTLKRLASISGSRYLTIQNNEGNTPLHLALMNKYKEKDLVLKTEFSEIANFLVEKCPEASYCPNEEPKSPLYMAAEAGDAEMVKLMIEKADGINMPMVKRGGRIAHAAITGKNIDVLKSVLSENPNRIKDRDIEGMTPLSYAASIGYREGVSYLLEKCADYTYESDQNGFFPIHIASSRGHIQVIKEIILRCPDSIELLDNHHGRNILHVAAMRGKAKVVNYMLKTPELKLLVNEKDKDGNTALHLASEGRHPKVVSILTGNKRVDLRLLNKEGKTALDIAGKYSGKEPSFREQLTWLALRYAAVSHASRPSTTRENPPSSKPGGQSSVDKNKETITENSQTSKPWEEPNMDNLKNRANTLALVATLVATVTFAAGFAVPGGNDDSEPHKGMAKFLQRHLFQAFIISNTIAMYSSVTAVVALIWAQLDDLNLVNASLKLAVPLLGLALAMVSFAFMTGSYLMVRGLNWLAYVVLIIGSFFIFILTILFLPLCLPSYLTHPFLRYFVYCQFSFLIMVTKSNADDREEK